MKMKLKKAMNAVKSKMASFVEGAKPNGKLPARSLTPKAKFKSK